MIDQPTVLVPALVKHVTRANAQFSEFSLDVQRPKLRYHKQVAVSVVERAIAHTLATSIPGWRGFKRIDT